MTVLPASFILSFLCLAVSAVTVSATPREFTDAKGRTISATFVGFQGKTAGLRLESGKVVYFPISKLSDPDRDYLQNHPARKLPAITIDPNSRYAVHDKDANYYYIDLKGVKQFDALTKNTLASQFDGKAALVDMGGASNAFIDQGAKILLHSNDTEATGFYNTTWSDDLLVAHDGKTKRFGYLDHAGKYVIPARYTRVLRMRDGVAWVTDDSNSRGKGDGSLAWKLINQKGEELAQLPKGGYPTVFSDGYSLITFRSNLKRRYVFYDTTGQPAFQGKRLNGRAHPFHEGVAFVGNGLIDRKGNWVIDPASGWDLSASDNRVSDGVLLASSRKRKENVTSVLLAATGEVVSDLPVIYDDFRLAGDGLIAVRHREKPKLWGCVDRLGNEVIPPKFTMPPSFTGGFGKVILPVKPKPVEAIIDRQGQELWKAPF